MDDPLLVPTVDLFLVPTVFLKSNFQVTNMSPFGRRDRWSLRGPFRPKSEVNSMFIAETQWMATNISELNSQFRLGEISHTKLNLEGWQFGARVARVGK